MLKIKSPAFERQKRWNISPSGGNSNNGVICGPFARNVNNDASNVNWNRRGR